MGLMFPKPKAKKKRKKHPDSIMHHKDGTCYLCMSRLGDIRRHSMLHKHHVFGGPCRQLAEEDGLFVWLCVEHHETGRDAVHNGLEGEENRRFLHEQGQRAYERNHTRQQFVDRYIRSYL